MVILILALVSSCTQENVTPGEPVKPPTTTSLPSKTTPIEQPPEPATSSPEPEHTPDSPDKPNSPSPTPNDAPSLNDVVFPVNNATALDSRITVANGWQGSLFLPGNGLPSLTDIVVTSDGNVVVSGCRGGSYAVIGQDGAYSLLVEESLQVYASDIDANGTIFGYNMLGDENQGGRIYRVAPDGGYQLFASLPAVGLQLGEAPMAISPDGFIYATASLGHTVFLYCIKPTGIVEKIAEYPDRLILEIGFDRQGGMYFLIPEGIIAANATDGMLGEMVFDRRDKHGWDIGVFSWHGMTIDEDGTFYVNTDSCVYRITPDSQVTLLAKDFIGLQGIALGSEGTVYVVSRALSTVFAIRDGVIRCLVPPSVVTPLTMAIDSQGNLFVCEDEAVMLGKYSPEGTLVAWMSGADVTQPPFPDLHVDDAGNVYLSEGTMHSRVVQLSNDLSRLSVVADALQQPGGLAFHDELLFVAEFGADRISIVREDGTVETFVENIERPNMMDADADGSLYVLHGSEYEVSPPRYLDRIDSQGTRTRIYSGSATAVAVTGGGHVLVGCSTPESAEVVEYDNRGTYVRTLISGLAMVGGIAIDANGTIYVSDDGRNCVIKLAKQ